VQYWGSGSGDDTGDGVDCAGGGLISIQPLTVRVRRKISAIDGMSNCLTICALLSFIWPQLDRGH
jgi:hypothetical protein